MKMPWQWSGTENSSVLGLCDGYIIGIEADWLGWDPKIKSDNPEISKAIEDALGILRDPLTVPKVRWQNAYLCEQLLARIMPIEQLRAEGDRILIESRALGATSVEELGQRWTSIKKEDNKYEADCRATYIQLLDELQWCYIKRSLDRKLRSDIAVPLFIRTMATLFFCVLPFVILILASNMGRLNETLFSSHILYAVSGYLAIAFGALGALFSRLITFQTRYRDIHYDEAISTFVGRSLNLRQTVGSIGSLIFFVGILGELIGGKLFPSPKELLDFHPDISLFGEVAKLIIWSFLAGFSERLVPDFLARTEATAASASRSN
jgi:hypothetical protein